MKVFAVLYMEAEKWPKGRYFPFGACMGLTSEKGGLYEGCSKSSGTEITMPP